MSSSCTWPTGCTLPVSRFMYCFKHADLLGIPKPDKAKTEIAKQSAKRKKEQPKYAKIVAAKIEEAEGVCQLKGPTCSYWAEGGDHLQNRTPGNYINPDNIIPACNNCNNLKVVKPELFSGKVISKFSSVLIKGDEVNGTNILIAEAVSLKPT